MELQVELEHFEGPLDLLLQLIRKNKIAIEDIPIHEITQSYLHVIEEKKEAIHDTMGDFLVLASELIYIKSRILLPVAEEEEEDPREDLMRRLLAYESFQKVSQYLQDKEGSNYERITKPQAEILLREKTPIEISQQIDVLCQAFYGMLEKNEESRLRESQVKTFIEQEEYDIGDCMISVTSILAQGAKPIENLLEFNSIPKIIAYFLALLELIKQETVHILKKEKMFLLQLNEEVVHA